MIPTNRRPREVDTSPYFCPHAGGDDRGWLGLGNLRANGYPSGGPWRQFHRTSCHGNTDRMEWLDLSATFSEYAWGRTRDPDISVEIIVRMTNEKPMPNQAMIQFAKQQYLNLESFKRNGTPVRTPVWFAKDDGTLYIYTMAKAGKVKRIRRNPQVRIVPCTMRGKVTGQWVEAEVQMADIATAEHGHTLLLQKYGWKKRLGNLFSGLMKRERVVMTIRWVE